MPKLTDDVKNFIVTQLAQFRGYAEVARLVTEETGVVVDRFQVRSYDPTNMAYAGSDKWRSIFDQVRSRYLNSIESVPIAHKAYRLNVLQQICDNARDRGNLVLAAATLEQAAKEVGNSLTNERNIRMNGSTNSLSELTPEERRAMVAEMLRNALDAHAQKIASSVN
jgi:hypothetical protein